MGASINAYGPLFDGARITPSIKKAAQKALDYGEYRIRMRSPVRTGALREGWKLALEGYGVRITNDVGYAIFNEMGTRFMRARPMAAPTIAEMQLVFSKELAQDIGKRLAVKVIRSVDGNPLGASDPLDDKAYGALTGGARGTTLGGVGFRNTGKNAKTLSYAQKASYNRILPKAFPSTPGRIQSPSWERAKARLSPSQRGSTFN